MVYNYRRIFIVKLIGLLYFVRINSVKPIVINSANSCHNTRMAPTPSGFLHVGNLLSFAITSAMAKKANAKVLLRIDDLDQARANDKYVQDIFDTLNYLEVPWDHGPKDVQDFRDNWSQANRMGSYHDALTRLCHKGLVFACTCSRQQVKNLQPCTCLGRHIPLDTENAAWRLITGTNKLEIRNYDGPITHAALPPEMQNFVIRRRDGIPAYQLASVVDDLHYNIDLIVRGQDLWSSTIAQHELALALGESRFGRIKFYHHPLLLEESGRKLSKSAGSASIKYLRENGRKPSDIYTTIGKMTGIEHAIDNWSELASSLSLQA